MSEVTVVKVLSHTEDMMMAVIEQQWDVFMEMELAQERMLKQLFARENVLFTEAENQGLVELQRLNKEMLAAAECHKLEIAEQLTELKKGRSKVNFYQTI